LPLARKVKVKAAEKMVVAKVAAKAEIKAAMLPVHKAAEAECRGFKLKVAVRPAFKVVAVLESRVDVANLARSHKAEPAHAPQAASRELKRAVVPASRVVRRASIQAKERAFRVGPMPPLVQLRFAHPAAMPFALPRPIPVLVSAAMPVQTSVVPPRSMRARPLASMVAAVPSPAPRLP
jgi:hypothetical protein